MIVKEEYNRAHRVDLTDEHLRASERHECEFQRFTTSGLGPRMKRVEEPRIYMIYGSRRYNANLVNGELVFPNFKVISGKEEKEIEKLEAEYYKLGKLLSSKIAKFAKKAQVLTLEEAEKIAKTDIGYKINKEIVMKQLSGEDKSVKRLE